MSPHCLFSCLSVPDEHQLVWEANQVQNYKSCRVLELIWFNPWSLLANDRIIRRFVVRMLWYEPPLKKNLHFPDVPSFNMSVKYSVSWSNASVVVLVSCNHSCCNHATALKFQHLLPFLRNFMVSLRRGRKGCLRRWTVSPKIRNLLSTDHFSLSVSLSNSSTTSSPPASSFEWFVNLCIFLGLGEQRLCTVENRWHFKIMLGSPGT